MRWHGRPPRLGPSGRAWRWLAPAVLVAVLLGAALADRWIERRQGRVAMAREMSAIIDLKLRALEWWHWERWSDARHFSELLPELTKIGREPQTSGGRPSTGAGAEDREEPLRRWMRSVCGEERYLSMLLLDPGGRVLMASSELAEGPAPRELKFLRGMPEGERIRIEALPGPFSGEGPGVVVGIRIPAEAGRGNGPEAGGWLLLRCATKRFFSTLLSVWPSPALSGRTVLVNRGPGHGGEVLFSTGLKLGLEPDAAWMPSGASGGEVKDAMKPEGPSDAAGSRILALARPVGLFPWEMGVWISAEAVDGPAFQHSLTVMGAVGALLGVVLGSGTLARRRREIGMLARELELRRRTQALAEQRELLNRSLVEHLPLRIYIKDREHRYVSCNGSQARMFGMDPASLVGRTDEGLDGPELAARHRAEDLRVLDSGRTLQAEDVRDTADGRVWTHWVKVPYRDEAGRVVGVLGIGQDVTRRKEMEEALQASEEKHRLLIEQMLDAVALLEVVYDATGKPVDYRFLDVNPAFETATGLRPSTVIGRCVTSTLPGLDPVWCERFGRTAVDGEPLRFEAYAAPLGRHFDVSVFRPRQGQVACAFEDTTGRKRVESALRASIEEKDALLKEVHHRVKNNLQIVTSLMHLQSMRLEAGREADAFRSTEDRVRSMALLHDTLYRSGNLAHADLRAYLNGLCAQLVHSFGLESGRIRVECRVDPMPLDLDRALPCGLIVSELVSNALRHAFPGGRSGRVAVTMSRETEERAMIEVSDDGVGLSPGFDPAAASTLGMQLILGLSAQLGGEAHFSVERPFKCRIDFPVPRESTGNEPGRVASGSSH